MQKSRKEKRTYARYLKSVDPAKCIFCGILPPSDQIVRETKHFKILKNIFAYSIWDSCGVREHLMIVPKRHVTSLKGLTKPEKVEYVDLIQEYESKHYDIFSRSPRSTIRSVGHVHTHCIKTDNRMRKFMFLLRKPYIRVTF